jgi:hypothetical protein
MNTKDKLLNEKGQSLAIVALIMIGLLAILALVIDGGMTYSHRRTAQVAADSSALASADELCRTRNSTAAYNVAVSYAGRNDATLTSFTWDLDARQVDVSVEIQFPTFFAQILGQPRVTVPATASAGCVPVGTGTGVLPVAWTCRPPIVAGEESEGGEFPESCVSESERLTLEEAAAQDRLEFDPRLFIIIDSNDTDFDLENVCYPDGSVICDLDGDGENDVFLGSGARGWLDLDDGSGGAAELSDWILHGFPSQIQIHDWLPNQTGVANRLFRDVETRRADISPLVAVPVFDVFCPNEPASHCPTLVHPQDRIMSGGIGANYYHIVGIAAFWITCVDAPGTHDRGDCPGLTEFIDQNPTINPSSVRAIEGYYLYGYVPGLGGSDGVDTGAYNILLTR